MSTITITVDDVTGEVTDVTGEEAFELAATSSLAIDIVVPAAARPYLQQWYLDTNEGDDVNTFVMKHLLRMALDYRRQKLSTSGRNTLDKAQAKGFQDYGSAYAAVKGALGV